MSNVVDSRAHSRSRGSTFADSEIDTPGSSSATFTFTVTQAGTYKIQGNTTTNGGGSDSFFGFFDIGIDLTTPLEMMPSRLGPWNLAVGLHALLLGDTTEQFNAGDSLDWVFSVGLSTTW